MWQSLAKIGSGTSKNLQKNLKNNTTKASVCAIVNAIAGDQNVTVFAYHYSDTWVTDKFRSFCAKLLADTKQTDRV